MPELPEVLTIISDLKKEIIGEAISTFTILEKNYKKQNLINNAHLFCGSKITSILNIGKLIVLELSNSGALVIHLGMSGRLLYECTDSYEKIRVHFNSGKYLVFSDIRKFGYFEYWDQNHLASHISTSAETIVNVKPDTFIKKLKYRKTDIKSALLNQKIVSGIGNIYATDALFLSKINPYAKCCDLIDKQLSDLHGNLQLIINEGLSHRGSSMNRYCDIYQKPGKHQNYFRVYGKRNKTCPDCFASIKVDKFKGRGNFYCPNCQNCQTP